MAEEQAKPRTEVTDPAQQPGESEDDWKIRTNRTTAAQGYHKDHRKHPDNVAKAKKEAAKK